MEEQVRKRGTVIFMKDNFFLLFFVVVVSALDMNDWAERTPEKEANSLILKPFSKEPLYLNSILIAFHSWQI